MSADETPRIPTDDELRAARGELDAILSGAGVDLGDPALWEPMPDLEDAIMAEAVAPAPTRRRNRWPIAVAAATILVAAVGAVVAGVLRSSPPDWSVTLAATDLAPDAVAIIDGWNEPAGTRLRLDIEDLPPAPDGYFYELWFSKGPVHISAGTFRDTQGVEMWAGVTRADFPRLWITLEPIDDDESPTDQTVLDTGDPEA